MRENPVRSDAPEEIKGKEQAAISSTKRRIALAIALVAGIATEAAGQKSETAKTSAANAVPATAKELHTNAPCKPPDPAEWLAQEQTFTIECNTDGAKMFYSGGTQEYQKCLYALGKYSGTNDSVVNNQRTPTYLNVLKAVAALCATTEQEKKEKQNALDNYVLGNQRAKDAYAYAHALEAIAALGAAGKEEYESIQQSIDEHIRKSLDNRTNPLLALAAANATIVRGGTNSPALIEAVHFALKELVADYTKHVDDPAVAPDQQAARRHWMTEALSEVSRMGQPAAATRPYLEEALRYPELADAAIDALGQIGPDGVAVLIKSLEKDISPALCKALLQQLRASEYLEEESARKFIGVFLNPPKENDPVARENQLRAAAGILEKNGRKFHRNKTDSTYATKHPHQEKMAKDAARFILEALSSRDRASSAWAQEYCSNHLGPWAEVAIDEFIAALQKKGPAPDKETTEPFVRGMAARALGSIQSEKAISPLLGALEDHKAGPRRDSGLALRKIGLEHLNPDQAIRYAGFRQWEAKYNEKERQRELEETRLQSY